MKWKKISQMILAKRRQGNKVEYLRKILNVRIFKEDTFPKMAERSISVLKCLRIATLNQNTYT
jgi:hypothetical protein